MSVSEFYSLGDQKYCEAQNLFVSFGLIAKENIETFYFSANLKSNKINRWKWVKSIWWKFSWSLRLLLWSPLQLWLLMLKWVIRELWKKTLHLEEKIDSVCAHACTGQVIFHSSLLPKFIWDYLTFLSNFPLTIQLISLWKRWGYGNYIIYYTVTVLDCNWLNYIFTVR